MKTTTVTVEDLQIVICQTEESFEALPGARVDLGERPRLRRVVTAKAAMWLAHGTSDDVAKANAYADREGWKVFVFGQSELDPLGRARKKILAR
jgi:hypothetical protein